MLVLRDQEDPETLAWLADDSEQRGDFDNTARYLWRLGAVLEDAGQKRDVLLREGMVHASELGKPDIAIERYERILKEVDSKCETALERIADLEHWLPIRRPEDLAVFADGLRRAGLPE